ncbi:hypothetical protein QQS21_009899 [Conoideocrella luteorostrata]|uniref:Uncharacterized protein n=1 Tax=Conoideocrella luteorostrata TaxID=1105319 RepID=A0AAJ0CKJ7_9HYPO|nr:hypothetical protein QQS21_009899 [Conoideocrella luteorostrata]
MKGNDETKLNRAISSIAAEPYYKYNIVTCGFTARLTAKEKEALKKNPDIKSQKTTQSKCENNSGSEGYKENKRQSQDDDNNADITSRRDKRLVAAGDNTTYTKIKRWGKNNKEKSCWGRLNKLGTSRKKANGQRPSTNKHKPNTAEPTKPYAAPDERKPEIGSDWIRQEEAPWNLARISNPSPNQNSYTYHKSAGTGTCVYVVDSGIDVDHPVSLLVASISYNVDY